MELLTTDGRIIEFIWLVIMFVSVWYYLDRAAKDLPLPKIRTIPATLAIEEGIGRSLEMGKPVHFSMGSDGASLMGSGMSTTIASLGLLRYLTKNCAQMGVRQIVHLPSQGYAIPLVEGAVREGYLEAGKPEMFRRGDLHYYGWFTAAFASGVYETFARDGVGLFVHAGNIITFSFPVLEAAKIHGAISIGGTPRWTATYIFAIACDHIFIGEELLAASAQISGNKMLTSGLASEEIWKYLAIGLLLVGLLTNAAGIDFRAIILG